MPTTPQVNTQQVMQMGTHTEKLQHTIQILPNVTAQQANAEREVKDEMKHTEVQDMESTYFIEETDPETGAKKRVRFLRKKKFLKKNSWNRRKLYLRREIMEEKSIYALEIYLPLF